VGTVVKPAQATWRFQRRIEIVRQSISEMQRHRPLKNIVGRNACRFSGFGDR
jgi:hypothetical protein